MAAVKKLTKKPRPAKAGKPVPKAKHKVVSPAGLPEPGDKKHWAALFRGQIVATTIHKFSGYVALTDQKAQGLIFMNSILIPVAMNWIEDPGYRVGAFICIVTAILSIVAAMICIYPKCRAGRKPDGTLNLLHYGDIAKLKEYEFLDEFLPVFNDMTLLSEAAAKDIHDAARRIIRPKLYWLKLSYIIFFFGNLAAISGTLYAIWYY